MRLATLTVAGPRRTLALPADAETLPKSPDLRAFRTVELFPVFIEMAASERLPVLLNSLAPSTKSHAILGMRDRALAVWRANTRASDNLFATFSASTPSMGLPAAIHSSAIACTSCRYRSRTKLSSRKVLCATTRSSGMCCSGFSRSHCNNACDCSTLSPGTCMAPSPASGGVTKYTSASGCLGKPVLTAFGKVVAIRKDISHQENSCLVGCLVNYEANIAIVCRNPGLGCGERERYPEGCRDC